MIISFMSHNKYFTLPDKSLITFYRVERKNSKLADYHIRQYQSHYSLFLLFIRKDYLKYFKEKLASFFTVDFVVVIESKQSDD